MALTCDGNGEITLIEIVDEINPISNKVDTLINDSHIHSNKVAIDKIIDTGTGTDFLANDGSYKFIDFGGGGVGDMYRSTYDQNNNGIVDNAEKINNLTVSTAVPPNAIFTDTIYNDSDVLKDSDANKIVSTSNKLATMDDINTGGAGNYLPLTGGTLTGELKIKNDNPLLYLIDTDIGGWMNYIDSTSGRYILAETTNSGLWVASKFNIDKNAESLWLRQTNSTLDGHLMLTNKYANQPVHSSNKVATMSDIGDSIGLYNNVKDYGAVGNGIADDTSSINAAIADSTLLYFPEGTYKVSETAHGTVKAGIIIQKNIEIKMNNAASIVGNVTAGNSYMDRRIVWFMGDNQYKLNWTGGTIEGKGVGKAHSGLYIEKAQNSVIDGLTILKCEASGIFIYDCYNCNVSNSYIDGCTSPSLSPGNGASYTLGYGVSFDGGAGNSLRDSHLNNNRHGVAGGHEGTGVLINGNLFTNGGLLGSDIDSHEECRDWVVSSNTVIAGDAADSWGGIVLRGDNMCVYNNTVIGNSSSCHGIVLTSYEYHPDTPNDPGNLIIGMGRVTGNTIRGCDVGVRASWAPGFGAIRILVSDNDISLCYECGIKTYTGVGKIMVSNNIINLTYSGAEGIQFTETSDPCYNISILDNLVRVNNASGIRVDSVSHLIISNNMVEISSNNLVEWLAPIYLNGCYKSLISGNSTKADGYQFIVNDSSYTTIIGNIGLQQDGSLPVIRNSNSKDHLSITGNSCDGAYARGLHSDDASYVIFTGNDFSDGSNNAIINNASNVINANNLQ